MTQISKRTGERGRVRPEDVLRGRAEVNVAQLLDLIHKVNPTGHTLPETERSRRYHLKGRLQSHLLRHFPGEVLVRADPQRDGLLLIEHRRGQRNGCHASMGNLDEDVRARVQFQLDQEGPAPPPRQTDTGRAPARTAVPTGGDDYLCGQQALSEYDYEAAREHFQRALCSQSHGIEAARALCSLLVEHLGLDGDALDLLPELPEGAAADPEVRLLLGLAAARCERPALALDLVQGIRRPQAAEVYLRLCRGALLQDRLDEAGEQLGWARERDPVHPDIHGLSQDLVRAHAAQCRPLEEQVSRLLQSGDHAAAEHAARAVLARWPDSEVARRALRALCEQRRQREALKLVHRGEEALARDDVAGALGSFREALASGAMLELRPPLSERIAALEEREREHRREARLSAAIAPFSQGDLCGCLRGVLDLPTALRREALSRLAGLAPQHPWSLFDEIEALRPGTSPRPVIDAALALLGAGEALETNPQEARDLLTAHHKLLETLPRHRLLLQDAQQRVLSREQEQARAVVEEARSAFDDAENADHVLRLLLTANLRCLPPEEETAARDLQARAERTTGLLKLRDRYQAFYAQRHWIEARDLADQLGQAGSGANSQEWFAHRDRMQALVQRVHGVRICPGPGPDGELCDFIPHARGAGTWLMPGGKQVLLCRSAGKVIQLRLAAPEGGRLRVHHRVLLQVGVPIRPIEAVVDGHSVVLSDTNMMFVRLSLPDYHVQYRAVYPPREDRTEFEAITFPGSDLMWAKHRGWTATSNVKVYDLSTQLNRSVVKEIPERRWARAVLGGSEPLVLSPRRESCLTFYTPRGRQVHNFMLEGQEVLPHVVVHPSGKGWLVPVLPHEDLGHPRRADEPISYLEVSETGAASAPRAVFGACTLLQAATSLYLGMTFWHFGGGRGQPEELLGLRHTEKGLVEQYRVKVPRGMHLVQDAASRHVVALALVPEGLEWVELGETPPRFTGPDRPVHSQAARADRVMECGLLEVGPDRTMMQMASALQQFSDTAVVGKPIDMQARIHTFLDALRTLLPVAGPLDMRKHAHEALKAQPDQPELRLLVAEEEVKEKNWGEVVNLLSGWDEAQFSSRLAAHRCHLLGLAHLAEGRWDEALRELTRCMSYAESTCQVEALLPLCEPTPQPLREADWDGHQPVLRQLLGAIRTADDLTQHEDPEGTLRVLDRQIVWQEAELQSAGRLAAAALAVVKPHDEISAQRQLLILGWFAGLQANARVSVPLQQDRASEEWLKEVAQGAMKRIDEEWQERFGGPASRTPEVGEAVAEAATEPAAEAGRALTPHSATHP